MSNTKLKIQLIGTENSNTNVITDSISIKSEIEESDVSEIARVFQKSIADSAVDEEILDTNIADSTVLLFSDQEITIKIDSSSDSLTLKPVSSGTKTPVFLIRGSIGSILVSNSSGSVANLDITRIKV